MTSLPMKIRNYFLAIKFSGKLKGEDLECYKFSSFCRASSIEGRLNAVWFHVANEISGNKNPVFGAKLKAFGKTAGTADYIFLHKSKSIAIEFKDPSNKSRGDKELKNNQLMFKEWCDYCNIPYELVFSSDEAIEILIKYNILN